MCKKVSLRTCRFAQVIVCDCWSAKNCGTYYCLPLRAKEKHAFNDAANKNGKSHALATYAGFWLKVTTFNAFHVWCRLKELNFKGGDMRILEIVKSICFRIRKDVFTEDLTCEFLIWVVSEFVTGNWEQLVKREYQSSCSPSSSTSSMSTHYCVSQCGFNVVGDFHWGWPPLVLSFFRTSSIKIVYTIQSSVVSFPFIGFRFSDLVPCYIPVPHRIRSWTHACRHDFFPLLPQLVLLLWQLLPRRRASLREPRLMRRNSRFPMVAATLRRMLRLKASKTILTRTAYVVQTSAALAKPYGCHSCQLSCLFVYSVFGGSETFPEPIWHLKRAKRQDFSPTTDYPQQGPWWRQFERQRRWKWRWRGCSGWPMDSELKPLAMCHQFVTSAFFKLARVATKGYIYR